MKLWLRTLTRLGHQADRRFDRLRARLGLRGGDPKSVQIVPYLGHGRSDIFYLTGRVLDVRPRAAVPTPRSTWDNLRASYHRFRTRELPGVRVAAQAAGAVQESLTDEEGYFTFELRPASPPPDAGWKSVQLSLPDLAPSGSSPAAVGRVLVPPADGEYGVISDVDDTIVESYARNPFKLARATLLGNAGTRLPFRGVAALYRALARGASGGPNPIFYVSSSPWNLYDLLIDYLALNQIPTGPLFLQDYGLDADKFIYADHHTHKLARIRHILAVHAPLRFVLIGDSGQQDPEIYVQIVREFPQRIRAVYIRDVAPPRRDAAVRRLAAQVQTLGVEMVLAPDAETVAAHAASIGLIRQ